MVLFNYSTRELTAKLVYYGPGLCGKTTNLQYIYNNLPEGVRKGKMLSLATKTDRTLFFDFLPIELGTIRGMKSRIQLYTVPGQVFYNSTRKLVLKGADGVVFVADSQQKMLEANVESYKNLEENLREMGIRIDEIPLVMQFNKRDLPNLASIEEMNTRINRHNNPFYESVAMTGIGVEDTLKAITKLVLNNLATRYKLDAGALPEVPSPATSPAPGSPAKARMTPAPEDLAIDALQSGPLPQPAPAAPSPAAAPTPPPTQGVVGGDDLVDDVIELLDEDALSEAPGMDEPVDLGEDLLEELENEPIPVVVHPSSTRPAATRESGATLHAVPLAQSGAAEEPIDLDEPIDLEESLPEETTAAMVITVGTLSPGQVREVEVPVRVTVGGKERLLKLKIGVRLSG